MPTYIAVCLQRHYDNDYIAFWVSELNVGVDISVAGDCFDYESTCGA